MSLEQPGDATGTPAPEP
jgi:hypothetical protein